MNILFFFLSLFTLGAVQGQTSIISGAVAETPVEFANKDYQAGSLEVSINMPSGKTAVDVEITLPQGFEYVTNSVTKKSGALSIAHEASSPLNKPVFKITGTGTITFSIKKKVTIAALQQLKNQGQGLKDTVKATATGLTDSKESNVYSLPIPIITPQLAEPVHNNASGTSVKKFVLRNTGDGATKEIFFIVKYPTGITSNEISYNGTVLTPAATLPSGDKVYKVTASTAAGFKKNDFAEITEKYTVSSCGNMSIVYKGYWGENASTLYESNEATRAVNVQNGTPNIVLDEDSNHTYFEWGDGLCGNKLGTFTVQYINSGSGNATAYDIQVNITPYLAGKKFRNHKPANFRIVATDGTEIPISSMTPNGNEIDERQVPLKDLAALSNTTLGTKDIGLKDIDNDGFRDDLPKDAKLKIRFDMVKNQGVKCLQEDDRAFSVSPHSNIQYKDACGADKKSDVHVLTNYTFRRLILSVVDAAKFPVELPKDTPRFGYIIFGNHSYITLERLKGQQSANNDKRFKYEIKLPAGVSMQNVKFYKGSDYGSATTPPIDLPNVTAGGTFSYTTTNTEKGYVTFDLLLTNPCVSGNVEVEYKISHLDKNGDGSYCEIPLLCNKKQINAICPGACSNNGPRMLNTKTERAENSYGWTDYLMTTRVTRSQVSETERQRALYLDDIEVTAEGQQGSLSSNNLYYHAAVIKEAQLLPKKIEVKVGSNPAVTLQATDSGVLTKVSDSQGNYFRWNLSSALPSGTIAANEKFTVIATYQVDNSNSANSRDRVKDIQSAGESFFYMLANPNDTNVNGKGYHTNELHCGAKQTPTFYIAETYTLIGTNAYTIKSCNIIPIGSNIAYLARRFNTSGNYFMNEFRPARLIKTVKFRIPSAYNIVRDVEYEYRRKYINWAEGSNNVKMLLSNFTVTDDGTYKTYTYVNPSKGSPGYLHPGELSVENGYEATMRAFVQATCASKPFVTETQAGTDNQLVFVDVEFEDFYYHYAANGGNKIASESHYEPIRYSDKPAINLVTQTPVNIIANKKEQTLDFKLTNTSVSDAPYGWVSVPDVAGITVTGLQEMDATGTNVLRTIAPEASLTGEKMFFLNQGGGDGVIAKNTERRFRLKYKITNCTQATLNFDLYAGWNCNSNPTQGYTKTCNDNKLTYTVKIAKSLKQIQPDPTNPGENHPDKIGTIEMCKKTKYQYTINSGDQGDLFDVKLIMMKGNGLTYSDVEVEYPLNSGRKYTTTSSPAIHATETSDKYIFDLTDILPGGSLPGSITENSDVNKRNFKISFNIQPGCDFTAGSAFDIDIEANNLCGTPADGDKTKVIIAGIQGVDANKYKVNNSLTLVGGNASACATSPAEYKGRHVIIDQSTPKNFVTGTNGRVVVRIPAGFEYVAGSFSAGAKSQTTFADPSLAGGTNPKPVAGGDTELSIQIPSGMRDNDFFEYTIKVKQKANTPIPQCSTEKKIKYYTTDSVTGVACPSGPLSPCPAITIETTANRGEVTIPVVTAALSIEDVQLSSLIQNNKEKVTVSYKIKNAATSTLTYTGDVKVGLFNDTDNNHLIDEATDEKLTDFTDTITSLAPGASQTVTHTIELTQDKLCRLLLSIRSSQNPCLCSDAVVVVSAPTSLTGLVQNATVCEGEEKVLTYNTQAPAYEGYTWTAVTTGALAHLSDANIAAPTFKYVGTKLTAEQEFTYKLTIRRANGCEASQEVKIKVTPATAAGTAQQLLFCGTDTDKVSTLEAKLRTALSAPTTTVIKIYDSATATVAKAATDSITFDTTYYYTLTQASTCESQRATVVAKGIKTPTVAEKTAATCTDISVAQITNYDSSLTYTFTKNGTAQTGVQIDTDGTIKNLPVGTYKVTASSTSPSCSSLPSQDFQIKDKLTSAKPIVTVAPATCAEASKAKITNYTAGYTYWEGTAQLTVNASGEITTPLTAGNHTIVAKNGTCESLASDPFTMTDQKATPSSPTVTTVTECPTLVSTQFDMATLVTASAGHTLKWYDAASGGTALAASPKVERQVTAKIVTTKYVSQEKDGCESARVAVTYTVDDTVAPSLTADDIVLDCTAANFDTLVTTWLTTTAATATDACTTPVVTNNYSKPTDLCGAGEIEVTFTAKDSFGNQTQKKAKIRFIVAKDDDYTATPVTPSTTEQIVKDGSGTPYNVLSNDKLYGNGATTSNVTISEVTPNANVKIDTTTGQVKVQPNTPVGTYTVTYRICDKNTPTACSNVATVTVKVTSSIDAVNDPDQTIPTTGGTVDILSNDKLNGNPVTKDQVNISIDSNGGLTGVAIDPTTGKLVVPNGTTPGTYTVTYKICDKANPTVCDTATVKITVPAIPPSIIANDDPDQTISTTGGTVDILSNDKLNGNPVTKDQVNISIDSNGGLTGVAIDPTTGKLVVPNGTTPGTYTVIYKICDKANPTVCDTATVKITVPATPTIKANDDPDTNIPRTGGSIDILSNDKLNGGQATKDNVHITIEDNGGLTTVMIDPTTGKLVVPNNSTPGTYTVTYKICDKANPTVCDTAKVKIIIAPGTIHNIEAVDDGVWEVGTQGEFLTPSVLNNDRIGSKTGLNASDVLIERTQGQPAPDSHLVMNDDGRITVKSGIAIGTYIYYYTIIDRANNNQTSSAKAIIKVVSFVAQQDEYSLTNTKDREQKTPSVITNDEMDGKKPPVIGTDVTLTPGTPSHPNLHMNPDGTITISPNTPDGVYTYDYTICRVSNPTDCKTTQAIINLHPSLVANDDDYTAHPVNVIHDAAVVGNVLENDTLGGASITDPTQVTITLVDNGGLVGVSFAPNGEVTVPQGAPAGTYRVRYNLCMSQQSSVCDDAVVTIVVSKEDPIEIYNGISTNGDGKNDGFRIEGIENYRKNTLKIFNRWGVLVYQKEGYTNSDPFTGYSNGRSTIESGKKLPQGTYYYILEYENSNNQTQTKSGWLYLKRD